jgi:adenosylhomocysteinase
VQHEVADPSLAADGEDRIAWADRAMPVLGRIRERFAARRPLDGLRVGACLHVTAETANLVRTLAAGGAEVHLCASNPLSTRDDVAAALAVNGAGGVAAQGIAVHAVHGADAAAYRRHVRAVVGAAPHLVLDDGCDLTVALHTERPELAAQVLAGCEDTPTGVLRLRAMAAAGALAFGVVALDRTPVRRIADHRHGTGQSTVDGILRAANLLFAGRCVVVAGFGPVGRGIAERARALGASVVVTEVDPVRALDAVLGGYRVMPMGEAAAIADVVVTATGNRDVVTAEHLRHTRDGVVLANAGHFDVEIDVRWLRAHAAGVRRVRPAAEEFRLADGRTVVLLAEGRIVNLGAAEGNPPAVMDMAFAEQALTTAWLARHHGALAPGVHPVPPDIGSEVARLELATLGVALDALSDTQRRYLSAWEIPTWEGGG